MKLGQILTRHKEWIRLVEGKPFIKAPYDHRYLESESTGKLLGDNGRDAGGEVCGRTKQDIAALDICPNILAPGVEKDCLESRHGELVVAPNIDTAQKGDINRVSIS